MSSQLRGNPQRCLKRQLLQDGLSVALKSGVATSRRNDAACRRAVPRHEVSTTLRPETGDRQGSLPFHSLSLMADTSPTYLAPVAGAIASLDGLHQRLLDDLDVERHGLRQLHGHTDPPRVALISEYLVASTHGVRMALADSAFSVSEYSEQTFADDRWVLDRLRRVPPGSPNDAYLGAIRRDEHAEKRRRRIRLYATHVFIHLAQALDRLAAIVVGIGAVRTDLQKASWPALADARIPEQGLFAQIPEAAARQRKYLADVLKVANDAGPIDWLPWLLAARNTAVHRAPKIGMNVMTKGSTAHGESSRLVDVFHRQPDWSDIEGLAVSGAKNEGLDDFLLIQEPHELLQGLIRSTAAVADGTVGHSLELWSERTAEPGFLIQPAKQWPRTLNELSFPGYDSPLNIIRTGPVHVSPDLALRMRASGVFDQGFFER
jgi:hypothetical protein